MNIAKENNIVKNAKVDLLTKEQMENLVKSSRTLQEVLKKIGYSSVSGTNRKTVQKRIEMYKISTKHFTKGVGSGIKRTEENIFCKNSTASQHVLRVWYLKGKYTEYKCSICGQPPVWQEKELSLTLDHINGDNTDDRLENIRWICPNCDRQLDTFGSKNKRKFKSVGE